MQAIKVTALGDPQVLQLDEHAELPILGADQVLVRNHAIGVNFSETERRRGSYDRPTLPWRPGHEGAGVVVAVGAPELQHWLKRSVAYWSVASSGSYAEYTAVPAIALISLPTNHHAEGEADAFNNYDYAQAAALPLAGLTAWNLCSYLGLNPNSKSGSKSGPNSSLDVGQHSERPVKVFVPAAAGAVGQILVQLLTLSGAEVLASASTAAKRAHLARLGVAVLEPTQSVKSYWAMGADLVIDGVGASTQPSSLQALAERGQLIFYGESSGVPKPIDIELLYPRSLRVGAMMMSFDDQHPNNQAARLGLSQLLQNRQLQLTVAARFTLAQAELAHRLIESRQAAGKVVMQLT